MNNQISDSSANLSIGIVTYNNAHLIARTVRSILTELPKKTPAEIVVLDNRSTDDTLAVVRRLAENEQRLRVIANDRNVGFGRGHNLILNQVQSTYHVFCNPDITLTTGALDVLVEFLATRPDVGIVCPRVHYQDGSLQPINHLHPTVLDLMLRRFVRGRLRQLFKTRMDHYEMLDIGYDRSYHVPFVSGAFMVCRSEVLKRVGGFDERYFLYFEDADMSRSVQAGGWRTVYCPKAVVVHGWQREAHKSMRAALSLFCSGWRYFNKWGWKFF